MVLPPLPGGRKRKRSGWMDGEEREREGRGERGRVRTSSEGDRQTSDKVNRERTERCQKGVKTRLELRTGKDRNDTAKERQIERDRETERERQR